MNNSSNLSNTNNKSACTKPVLKSIVRKGEKINISLYSVVNICKHPWEKNI